MPAVSPGALRLRAWRATDRALLAASAGAVHADWSAGWGLDGPSDPASACRQATPADAELPGWVPWRARAGARLWWSARADADDWLRERLFGDAPRPGSLAARVPEAALDNLQDRLLAWAGAAPQADGPAPAAAALGPWSGALLLQMPTASLLLSGDWMAAWSAGTRTAADQVSRPAALCPLREALADQPLRLQVRLAGDSLPLGGLAAWRCGQVVRLRHRVDQPVQLTDDQGRVWHHAWLVDLEGRRAVELAPGTDPASHTEESHDHHD